MDNSCIEAEESINTYREGLQAEVLPGKEVPSESVIIEESMDILIDIYMDMHFM